MNLKRILSRLFRRFRRRKPYREAVLDTKPLFFWDGEITKVRYEGRMITPEERARLVVWDKNE